MPDGAQRLRVKRRGGGAGASSGGVGREQISFLHLNAVKPPSATFATGCRRAVRAAGSIV